MISKLVVLPDKAGGIDCPPAIKKISHPNGVAYLFNGAGPLPNLLKCVFYPFSSKSVKILDAEVEYFNIRLLPLCKVCGKDPFNQTWLIGKETLQGPRNGR